MIKQNLMSNSFNTLNAKSNLQQALYLLKKFSVSWKDRAQIRYFNFVDHIKFINDADDFLVNLLPFKDHPLFLNASDKLKRKILSCGWIIYNQKTLSIETEIVHPTSTIILNERIPGVNDNNIKQVISETMIDESFHVLLVVNAIDIIKQKRNLSLKVPEFNLIKNMKLLKNKYTEPWKKTLIQLATTIVSEIFISDYLKLISENEFIQPINRFSVKVHRDDELVHSNIFKNLVKCIYANLTRKEKNFFSKIFPKPIRWFSDRELNVWESVLKQIKFKNSHEMIKDCYDINSKLFSYFNYSNLISLADEIGITNNSIGLDSFYEEGLLR